MISIYIFTGVCILVSFVLCLNVCVFFGAIVFYFALDVCLYLYEYPSVSTFMYFFVYVCACVCVCLYVYCFLLREIEYKPICKFF